VLVHTLRIAQSVGFNRVGVSSFLVEDEGRFFLWSIVILEVLRFLGLKNIDSVQSPIQRKYIDSVQSPIQRK
jgi:hypothetical protein